MTKKWPFLEAKSCVRSKILIPTVVFCHFEHPLTQQIVNRTNNKYIFDDFTSNFVNFWQLCMYVHNVTQNDQKMALLEAKNGVRSPILIPTVVFWYFEHPLTQQIVNQTHKKYIFDNFTSNFVHFWQLSHVCA